LKEELSEKSGLSLRTIQRIENGEGTPREDSLHLLTKNFNIPTNYFSKGERRDLTLKEVIKMKKIPLLALSLTVVGYSFGSLIGLKILPHLNTYHFILKAMIVLSFCTLFSDLGLFVGILIERVLRLFSK
jgi:transcriptional regulator with XRE-family HTH domain